MKSLRNLAACVLLLVGTADSQAVHQEYTHMKGMSNNELKQKFLGLIIKPKEHSIFHKQNPLLMLTDELPDSFDSRTKWGECIHPIRNQMHCGSCWAFAGSEVLSDRLCIASGGKRREVLSAQYMVSCDSLDHGCQGGELDQEWTFLAE